MTVPLVVAVRMGCRNERYVALDQLQPGDRLMLGETGLSIRIEEVSWHQHLGLWRVRGNDSWDVVHVLFDGSILELVPQ